jgi:hypothetical protein
MNRPNRRRLGLVSQLDQGDRHGNCEEGPGQEGCTRKEGSGKEGCTCKEGSSQEGSG